MWRPLAPSLSLSLTLSLTLIAVTPGVRRPSGTSATASTSRTSAATAPRTRRTGRSAAITPTLALALALAPALALALALAPALAPALALALAPTLALLLSRSLGCQANWPCLPHAAPPGHSDELAAQGFNATRLRAVLAELGEIFKLEEGVGEAEADPDH